MNELTHSEKVEQSPWARESGENVECDECPLLFDREHPNLPLVCKARLEQGGKVCPHCALS